MSLLLVGCSNKIADGSTDGAKIFQDACVRCHGADGQPSKSMLRSGVKSLKTERMRRTWSDEQIRDRILRGSVNKKMPAFQGALSDEQVVALITYVRSLAKVGDKPADTSAVATPATAKSAAANPATESAVANPAMDKSAAANPAMDKSAVATPATESAVANPATDKPAAGKPVE